MLKDFLGKYFDVMGKLSSEEVDFIKFGPTVEPGILHALLTKGFWHVLFIGSNKTFQYGLRIMPGRKWQEWPMVKLNGDYSCSTIGPGMPYLFEFLKLSVLHPDFDLADHFHKNLAGFNRVISPVLDVLEHAEGWDFYNQFILNLKNEQEPIGPEKSDCLYVDFWNHFDTSDEHKLLRSTIQKIMNSNQNYLPDIDPLKDYGIWSSRIYHVLISWTATHSIKTTKISEQSLINCFDQPHCYDVELAVRQQSNGGLHPRVTMFDFAEKILKLNIFDKIPDPICHSAKRFCESGKYDYWGDAHIESAAFLDEVYGQPLRSWYALINAAYWSGQNLKKSLFPTWEAAIELCKRNNWADAQYALEYQMGVYRGMEGK